MITILPKRFGFYGLRARSNHYSSLDHYVSAPNCQDENALVFQYEKHLRYITGSDRQYKFNKLQYDFMQDGVLGGTGV